MAQINLKKALSVFVIFIFFFLTLQAESRVSYKRILRLGENKKRIKMDEEVYVRAYLKPKNPEVKIDEVSIWIEQDGQILKALTPTIRTLTKGSASKDHPWEVLLPVGDKYRKKTSLHHNLKKGALNLTLNFREEIEELKGEKTKKK